MQSTSDSKVKEYAVWEHPEYGYAYGKTEQAGENKIVAYCDDYEDARITWKWYYYKP